MSKNRMAVGKCLVDKWDWSRTWGRSGLRTENTEFQCKNLLPSVQHVGGSIMVWTCFTASEPGIQFSNSRLLSNNKSVMMQSSWRQGGLTEHVYWCALSQRTHPVLGLSQCVCRRMQETKHVCSTGLGLLFLHTQVIIKAALACTHARTHTDAHTLTHLELPNLFTKFSEKYLNV